jgi:hypothetical protein
MAPTLPKKVRVVNQAKKDRKILKTKAAEDRQSNAQKKQETEKKTTALLKGRKAELEHLPEDQKTEEVKNELIQIQKDEVEAARKITEARVEETNFDKDYSNAQIEDDFDEVD